MTYPILWFLGLITLAIALQITEEVYRLALLIVIFFFLGWIYAISPLLMQLFILCFVYVGYHHYRASLKS